MTRQRKDRHMKKSFKLENLGCASCAAKMETAINKLPSVEDASISFMAERLNLTSHDMDRAVADAQKVISKIERHCKIKVKP